MTELTGMTCEELTAWTKEAGYPGLYVWTLEGNGRAKAFYEAMGMTATGESREFEIAGAYLPEVKYQLKW